MFVRDNKTTPCCGNKLWAKMKVHGSSMEYVSFDITCRYCQDKTFRFVPVLDLYRTIRKNALFFPSDHPMYECSTWPVEGSVVRYTYIGRIIWAMSRLSSLQVDPLDQSVMGILFNAFTRRIYNSFVVPVPFGGMRH